MEIKIQLAELRYTLIYAFDPSTMKVENKVSWPSNYLYV